MEALIAVSIVVLLIALVIVTRLRRGPVVAAVPVEEPSMFVSAPVHAVDGGSRRPNAGTLPLPILLADRIQGGVVAALLLGGIVAALEISGVAGSLGAILARPAAELLVVDRLGTLVSGAATVALVAFAIGFAYPRLVHRIA
jgi:hypothetical protein